MNDIKKNDSKKNDSKKNDSKKRGKTSKRIGIDSSKKIKMNEKKDKLLKLYKVNDSDIKNYHLSYFYLDYPIQCCDFKNMNPYFNNIKPYQYSLLAKKMFFAYKNVKPNNFFIKFINEISKINEQIIKPKNNIFLNQFILTYSQCRPNCKILTKFPNCNYSDSKIQEILEDRNYMIYAIKKIQLSTKAAHSLIYQMYAYHYKLKKMNHIEKYCEKIGWIGGDDDRYITVFLIEQKNNTNRSNRGTSNKRMLIPYCHLSDSFMNTIVLSKTYFNENSIKFLHTQLLDNILSNRFKKCNILLNSFVNYLFKNIELFDIDKFMVISGSVLYSHGLRQCSDVDFFINNNPNIFKTKNFVNKIEKYLLNENTKFFFTDGYTKLIPNLYWKDFWVDWHSEWASTFGASNMIETIYDPKFHYYYMGIKYLIIDAEVNRRNLRGRPNALSDLIAYNKLLGKNIKINPVKKETIKDDVVTKTTESKFLSVLKWSLQYKYQIKMSIDELKKIVKFE